mgnify:CR=1 FL=1
MNFAKKKKRKKWRHLKKQVQKLLETEKKSVHQLVNFDFIEMNYKEFEKKIEAFSKILDTLNVMKRIYKFECISILEKFIPKEKENTMLEIINNIIGLTYEENISKIVVIWRNRNGL